MESHRVRMENVHFPTEIPCGIKSGPLSPNAHGKNQAYIEQTRACRPRLPKLD